MQDSWLDQIQKKLLVTKNELEQRLSRINQNHRRPLDPDSTERATQLENQEVVDALGREAREELDQVNAAIARIEASEYGICEACNNPIRQERLLAYPHAARCIDCAKNEVHGDERQQVSG